MKGSTFSDEQTVRISQDLDPVSEVIKRYLLSGQNTHASGKEFGNLRTGTEPGTRSSLGRRRVDLRRLWLRMRQHNSLA